MLTSPHRTSWAMLLAALTFTPAQGQTATQPDYHGILLDRPATTEEGLAGRSISAPTGFTTLSTVVMTPVLYCGIAGGDRDEYAVPNAPAGAVWLLQVPSPPPGAKIFDARYELLDNIAAVGGFSQINVWPVDDSHVDVAAVAYPNCNTRLRLKVVVTYAK